MLPPGLLVPGHRSRTCDIFERGYFRPMPKPGCDISDCTCFEPLEAGLRHLPEPLVHTVDQTYGTSSAACLFTQNRGLLTFLAATYPTDQIGPGAGHSGRTCCPPQEPQFSVPHRLSNLLGEHPVHVNLFKPHVLALLDLVEGRRTSR